MASPPIDFPENMALESMTVVSALLRAKNLDISMVAIAVNRAVVPALTSATSNPDNLKQHLQAFSDRAAAGAPLAARFFFLPVFHGRPIVFPQERSAATLPPP